MHRIGWPHTWCSPHFLPGCWGYSAVHHTWLRNAFLDGLYCSKVEELFGWLIFFFNCLNKSDFELIKNNVVKVFKVICNYFTFIVNVIVRNQSDLQQLSASSHHQLPNVTPFTMVASHIKPPSSHTLPLSFPLSLVPAQRQPFLPSSPHEPLVWGLYMV